MNGTQTLEHSEVGSAGVRPSPSGWPTRIALALAFLSLAATGLLGYGLLESQKDVEALQVAIGDAQSESRSGLSQQRSLSETVGLVTSDVSQVQSDVDKATQRLADLEDRVGGIGPVGFGNDHDSRLRDVEDRLANTEECINAFYNRFVYCQVEYGSLLP